MRTGFTVKTLISTGGYNILVNLITMLALGEHNWCLIISCYMY